MPSFPACSLRVRAAAPAAKTPRVRIQSGFSWKPYDCVDDRVMTGKPLQAGFRPEPGAANLERLAEDRGARRRMPDDLRSRLLAMGRGGRATVG